jgi:hypothetical protein
VDTPGSRILFRSGDLDRDQLHRHGGDDPCSMQMDEAVSTMAIQETLSAV